jgi:phosphoglycerate dehydrogenase-like enzyme
MTRMLLTRAAFDRVQPQLGALQDRLEWILMERHGSLDYRGRTVAPRDAGAECAWVSHDLFTDGLVPRFSDVLREQDGLAWVQSAGAGFDHPMFAMLAGMGVRLTTNHGQAVGMAEYVLWGVLDHFQGGRMLELPAARRRSTRM